MKFSLKHFKPGINLVSTLFMLLISINTYSNPTKKSPVLRVDPPFWWTGMKEQSLQLVVHGTAIQQYDLKLEAADCKILKVTKPSNANYIFVELSIGEQQQPEDIKLQFLLKNKMKFEYCYSLKARTLGQKRGIDASDLIYLVFPDRFANGDMSNDASPLLNEKTMDRNGLKSRHGGDLAGISNHLDYFKELGVTALWINPVLENNQPLESYHGYAATDLYKVDMRFGTNESYKALVDECHKEGIKMIWDVVYNHWGNENWMFRDMPDSNWFHWFPEFTRTSYRAETLLDPYAAESDKNIMTNAWFDKHMPDLNQQDPQLAKYLIQNSIWWIEYAGLDAFRIDTYAYPDQQFMKSLNEAIRKEYTDFVLFGETWVQGSPVQSWFTELSPSNSKYSSSLQGVTDFQLYFAITKGLNENFGWEEGFRRIQMTLSHDVLYHDPNLLVTFLDNHDLSRYYSVVNEDFAKWKMGVAMLYTLRGIPSIYYGHEILMKNYADPDAKVREDFPGGWPADGINKFTAAGRNTLENQAFDFCKKLGTWRKNNSWMGLAKLTQFVPMDNTYVYFRTEGGRTLMCIYNGNDKSFDMDLTRFDECIKGRTSGRDIISEKNIQLKNTLTLEPKSTLLIELE
jgi:neopullulanase